MVNITSTRFVTKKYPTQGYSVFFDRESGFFARIENEGKKEPFWAENGPELLDISITNWCDKQCSICYRDSSTKGIFMKLTDYREILRQASETNVFQIALGGGNPNQHPDFIEMLKIAREEYNIVPNYTTNGRGLTQSVLKATKEFCGAVAVSISEYSEEAHQSLNYIRDYKIKTNVHFVLTSKSIDTAIQWLKNPPSFLDGINAVVFLNYKPVGRKADVALNLNQSNKLAEYFKLINSRTYPFKIGVDSCSVSGVVSYLPNINPISIDTCEAARFSAFISEDLKIYPCSFMVDSYAGIDLKNGNMFKAWRDSDLFQSFRTLLFNNGCHKCHSVNLCLGGCPLFKTINLCKGC